MRERSKSTKTPAAILHELRRLAAVMSQSFVSGSTTNDAAVTIHERMMNAGRSGSQGTVKQLIAGSPPFDALYDVITTDTGRERAQ